MKKKTLFILGSSRSEGDTRSILDYINDIHPIDIIDLNDYHIEYYKYAHDYSANDQYLDLMEKITLEYDQIVFATPVYWYTMSAVMKTFFDRISDLLRIRKDTGRRLREMKMAVISCSNADDVHESYSVPFKLSADYLGMEFISYIHTWKQDGEISDQSKSRIEALISSL